MKKLTSALLAGALLPLMASACLAGPAAARLAGDSALMLAQAECVPGAGVKCARNDGGDAEDALKKRKNGDKSRPAETTNEGTEATGKPAKKPKREGTAEENVESGNDRPAKTEKGSAAENPASNERPSTEEPAGTGRNDGTGAGKAKPPSTGTTDGTKVREDSDAQKTKVDEPRRKRVEQLKKERVERHKTVREKRDAARQRERGENLADVRKERRETRENGAVVIDEGSGRTIVKRENGDVVIRNDESNRINYAARDVEVRRLPDGTEELTAWRKNGVRVVTLRDGRGNVIRRTRVLENGRSYVLFENDPMVNQRQPEIVINLPPVVIGMPSDRYVVEAEASPPEVIYETFAAPPVQPVQRGYTLEQVVNSPDSAQPGSACGHRLRSPSNSGSWRVDEGQIDALDSIAESVLQLVRNNPGEVFLVEGHTDAVGSDIDNLSLSDRRAEEVAYLLSEYYDVPSENLTTRGYGERYLKVPTEGPSRINRRVTMRRITPLLETSNIR